MTKQTSNSHRQPKAVIFDYDDTLVESLAIKWAQHKHVAKKEYNKTLSDDEIRLHWTKPYSQLITALYEDTDVNRARENNQKYEAAFPKRLLNETISLLSELHKRGIITGVVSSTNRTSLVKDLERFHFNNSLLDYIQTEEDTQYHKPDARVFEPTIKWLAQRNIKPSDVIYVGDGLHDMKAAGGAGFDFVGITTGLIDKHQFSDNSSRSIEKLSELLNYM